MSEELALTIDHISLSTADIACARSFYDKALAPLGLEKIATITAEQSGTVEYAGYGKGRKGTLWIAEGGKQTPATHICFRTKTRAAVRAFHAAGLEAGGTDNGAPGIREAYHPEYYAAFVIDPEGHNIEAVCFNPEEPS